MKQKVKILSKYSIDAIEYDFEKKKAEAILKDLELLWEKFKR